MYIQYKIQGHGVEILGEIGRCLTVARRKHRYSAQYKNVSHNISYKKGHWFLRKAFIRANFMESRKTS